LKIIYLQKGFKKRYSMGCVTICISDELEIAFRRLVRLKYGEKQGKISRGDI